MAQDKRNNSDNNSSGSLIIRPATLLFRSVRTLSFILYLVTMAIGLNITQLISILVAPFSRQTLIKINAWVAGTMWRAMQRIVERRNGMDITFSGDEVPSNESAIIISNHSGLVDFYLVNSLAVRKNMISHCSYFAKNSVKYVPFWGWGMWLCGMLMIKRNWLQDQKKIEAVFHRIRTWQPPVWVISFLEGTRLTPKKLAESQAFSRSRGLPVLRNLLAPRTKGFCETVHQLRNTHVKHVYDLTIAYWHCERGYGHPPSLLRMHTHSMQGQYQFHVHVKRYAIEDLPEDDQGLTTWVHERFQEKDAFLEELKTSWVEHQDVRRIPME